MLLRLGHGRRQAGRPDHSAGDAPYGEDDGRGQGDVPNYLVSPSFRIEPLEARPTAEGIENLHPDLVGEVQEDVQGHADGEGEGDQREGKPRSNREEDGRQQRVHERPMLVQHVPFCPEHAEGNEQDGADGADDAAMQKDVLDDSEPEEKSSAAMTHSTTSNLAPAK